MRSERFAFVGLALLAGHFFWSPSAFSEDKEAPQQSVATPATLYDKISEKAALTYFGIYRGASIEDPTNSQQPDLDGSPDPKHPQSVESYVTAGYKVDKNWMIGVTTHFNYFPGGNPAGNGQNIDLLDPSLVISKANLIEKGNFKLKGLFYTAFPMSSSDFLKPRNYLASLAPTLVATYEMPKIDLSLGVFGYLTAYIPSSDTPDQSRTYKLYAAPYANYSLSKTVALTMWVDLVQVTRNSGTGFISGMDNAPIDIEPGINWDVSKFLSVNPILNIYPTHLTLASTSIQAIVVGKVF